MGSHYLWEVLKIRDRQVQYPNRFRLSPVSGQENVYDITPVPGTVTQAGTALNKANLLSDATAALLGLTGDPTVNDALELIGDKARYAKGSYVGTGTHGSSDPNTISFPFAPKLVIVATTESGARIPPVVFVSGATATVVSGGTSTTTYAYTVTWSGNTLSWYVPSSTAAIQLNKSNIVYGWIALG